MNVKKIITLLLALVLAAGMVACGTKGSGTTDGMSNEPKNAEEAAAMHKELMAQENAILSENTALWEKVFMAADKGMTMQEDGKNYGEFLLDTIESAKDQFTADELKLLQGEAEKIRDIEDKLTMLEEKYPDIAQESTDGDMSVPAGMLISPSMDICAVSGYFSSSSVSLFSILLISVADSFNILYSSSVNWSLALSMVSSRKSP